MNLLSDYSIIFRLIHVNVDPVDLSQPLLFIKSLREIFLLN